MIKLLVLKKHYYELLTAQTDTDERDSQPKPFLWKVNQSSSGCWWRIRPHCSLRSHGDVCGWLELWQDFHSSGALKIPIMPKLRTRLTASAPMVPRRDGAAPWSTSHAFRDAMSANTPCIWKWVPTTALMWKSWWLWPVWKKTRFSWWKQKGQKGISNDSLLTLNLHPAESRGSILLFWKLLFPQL